eukprot:TRINITY_DN3612_c0_g1_i1.p1 TRINITY_DN3612_c0_g1~~TRINITY_DN3612_c0_g1_i1.p1  ORF type:complete len:201 (+),score=15.48 TRINITY_DN3612_c0_g1_i1:71-673(+)
MKTLSMDSGIKWKREADDSHVVRMDRIKTNNPIPNAGESQQGNVRMDLTKWKTQLCHHFRKGTCTHGDDCLFAHGEHELKPVNWLLCRPRPIGAPASVVTCSYCGLETNSLASHLIVCTKYKRVETPSIFHEFHQMEDFSRKKEKKVDKRICGLCLETLTDNVSRFGNCEHMFHNRCISKAARTIKAIGCPICKRQCCYL